MDSFGRAACNGFLSAEKKSVSLVADSHGQQILTVLQNFREQNVFFDFNIIVKEESIPCHRCVLAASSDFFR
ncbi:hypothetical protein GDO81_026528 [Engystomops pustulosus]|uniref:BTB domain-containing protein n=1 Tax=Engystomops pustulosus TaxID=76066 RepID=A0AAV6YJT5_ENGPU|nr:hypothetical protein GDO81_026528 [Engystomops pustulosus]